MKLGRVPHRWNITATRAVALQRSLAGRIAVDALSPDVRFVAGLDAAPSADGDVCLAAAVVWDLRERTVVEQRLVTRPFTFPYVPGLLSFRETPALLDAMRLLDRRPDVLLCDGHGLAHPRRFGIACHVGFICDVPSIGCAKSRLVGVYREPAPRRGASTALIHQGEVVARVVRTRTGVKPVFVSVGHRADLASATRLVLACAMRYRIPEPIRLADRLVAWAKRKSG